MFVGTVRQLFVCLRVRGAVGGPTPVCRRKRYPDRFRQFCRAPGRERPTHGDTQTDYVTSIVGLYVARTPIYALRAMWTNNVIVCDGSVHKISRSVRAFYTQGGSQSNLQQASAKLR